MRDYEKEQRNHTSHRTNYIGGSVAPNSTVFQYNASNAASLAPTPLVPSKNLKTFSPAWFLFHQNNLELIGRQTELSQLNEFLSDGRSFLWQAITGPAGVGKTRLAYEFLKDNQELWEGGFLGSVARNPG